MDDRKKQELLSAVAVRRQAGGFTLIEVAIVIGLIAMVTASIAIGARILDQARLRKQISQITLIESGVQNFRIKYDCFAGDCADPTIISGYTYSGNGNGFLEATWNDDENKGFWLHLSLSQMIADSLVAHGVLASMNTPRMVLNADGVINAYGNMTYAQNVLEFDTNNVTGAFKMQEIKAIDTKLDDGLASSGIVRSTGYGSGATNVYNSAPTFPLSTSSNSGSTQCISGGIYSGLATYTNCNMVYILGNS